MPWALPVNLKTGVIHNMAEQTTFNNGHMQLPDYVGQLLAPTSSKVTERKTWGIGVESTVVPFFTATNVTGQTNIDPDVLGAPVRLARDKDGSIRFGSNGRPAMRIHPDISRHVGVMRENFIASLQAYTGMVQDEMPDQYAAQVAANQTSALPISDKDQADVTEAVRLLQQKAASTAQATEPQAEPEPEQSVDPDPKPAKPARNGRGAEPSKEPAEAVA